MPGIVNAAMRRATDWGDVWSARAISGNAGVTLLTPRIAISVTLKTTWRLVSLRSGLGRAPITKLASARVHRGYVFPKLLSERPQVGIHGGVMAHCTCLTPALRPGSCQRLLTADR